MRFLLLLALGFGLATASPNGAQASAITIEATGYIDDYHGRFSTIPENDFDSGVIVITDPHDQRLQGAYWRDELLSTSGRMTVEITPPHQLTGLFELRVSQCAGFFNLICGRWGQFFINAPTPFSLIDWQLFRSNSEIASLTALLFYYEQDDSGTSWTNEYGTFSQHFGVRTDFTLTSLSFTHEPAPLVPTPLPLPAGMLLAGFGALGLLRLRRGRSVIT